MKPRLRITVCFPVALYCTTHFYSVPSSRMHEAFPRISYMTSRFVHIGIEYFYPYEVICFFDRCKSNSEALKLQWIYWKLAVSRW